MPGLGRLPLTWCRGLSDWFPGLWDRPGGRERADVGLGPLLGGGGARSPSRWGWVGEGGHSEKRKLDPCSQHQTNPKRTRNPNMKRKLKNMKRKQAS